MKKAIFLPMLALVFAFYGCAMPTTSVRTVDDRPTLAFKGAPVNAILYIDGLNMGLAGQYDGESKVLTVEPGSHTVRVIDNNETIYEQRFFVESSLKTIVIK